MATSFADALTPLARSMPRPARSIEILRVSAQLDGDHFDASANKARAAVLKWASKRAGAALPKDAWDQRDFDLMAGGRNSTAVRISNDAMDFWALRAEDPDKTVAGRVWSTEVVIGGEAGKRPHLSLRLIVNTNELDFRVEPHVPGTVLQMIEAPGLIRGARPLLAVPRAILSENDAEDLCDHLEDPERRLPMFVVVVPNDDGAPPIDDAALAKATAGLARVVRMRAEVCEAIDRDPDEVRGAIIEVLEGSDLPHLGHMRGENIEKSRALWRAQTSQNALIEAYRAKHEAKRKPPAPKPAPVIIRQHRPTPAPVAAEPADLPLPLPSKRPIKETIRASKPWRTPPRAPEDDWLYGIAPAPN